jgi:putative oxidoreductase
MILRRLARPMLAAIFVWSGVDILRNPGPRVKVAAPLVQKVKEQAGDQLPDQVPTDPETLVKIDAAVKIGAGLLFGLGKFPRLSALVLAASLLPGTVAEHAFWAEEDPEKAAAQRVQFLKDLGLAGGLLIASADTAGRPSVVYRAKETGRQARRAAKQAQHTAALNAKLGIEKIRP